MELSRASAVTQPGDSFRAGISGVRTAGAAHYADLSLQQWMALTPPGLLKAHPKLSDETLAHLRKEKDPVVSA